MSDGFAFNVFVSYRQQDPDRAWVRQVLRPALQAAGVTTFIDYEQFRLGEPVITEMERGVETSAYTLAVVSPRYVESRFAEFENLVSQHFGLEGSGHRLIVLMRERCELPLRLRYKLWVAMTTPEEFDENMPKLIETLKQRPGH